MKPNLIFKFSLYLSLILSIIKCFAFYITRSDSIYASFVDSLSDSLVAVVMLITVMIINMPKSNKFPFGFHRLESLIIFLEGILISYTSIFGIYHAGYHLIYPENYNIDEYKTGIFIMIISILLISIYLHIIIKYNEEKHNALVKTNIIHYQSDLISNALIVINLILVYLLDIIWIDKIIGIICFSILLKKGTKILFRSIRSILDMSIEDKILNRIKHIIMTILDKHNFTLSELKTKSSGSIIFIHLILSSQEDNISLNHIEEIKELINKYVKYKTEVTLEVWPVRDSNL